MYILIFRGKRYGGIITFLFNFLEIMKFNQNDIIFVNEDVDKSIVNKINSNYNIKIKYLPEYNKNIFVSRWLQGLYILNYLKNKTKKKLKIIFIDWNLILDWIPHLLNVRIYSFVHTYPSKKLPSFLSSITKRILNRSEIVTVSDYSANRISEKWRINKEDIEIIYNFSNLPGTNRKKNPNENFIKITTIAHCENYKNPKLWLEIAKDITSRYRNVSFNWYGDGSQYYKYNEITKDNLQIYFHGYSSEIEEILSEETFLYIQCSTIENFSVSIVDALNYSIPTLVSNRGGMPEAIEDGRNGFVCENKGDFVQKIEFLLSNPKEYSNMSLTAKKIYQKKFSKEVWEKNINKLFEKRV